MNARIERAHIRGTQIKVRTEGAHSRGAFKGRIYAAHKGMAHRIEGNCPIIVKSEHIVRQ